MAPRYEKNDTSRIPSFPSLLPASLPCGISSASLVQTLSFLKPTAVLLSIELWGFHGVQVVFAAYVMLWRAETFLLVASFILSLYEVRQTHDAGLVTLWRNCILWLLWGLEPGPMEWGRVIRLLGISLSLVMLHIWRKREEKRRIAKKTERESLLLLAPDGVVIVEKDGKAIRCNTQALEMMKAGSEAELLTMLENYTSEGSILSRATSDGPNPFYTSHSGRSFEWKFLTSPERTFLFIRDISSLESLQASIPATASFTQFLLTDFLQQIRIPANSIVNLTEEVGDSGGFAMKVFKSAAQTLASVMSDLRDNEQMKSGAFALRAVRFQLKPLISECVRIMAPQAALKRMTITMRYDPTIPPLICNDPSRVRQVVLTLLNDAIKFNSSGCLELVAVSTRDNTVKVSIEDPDSRCKDLGEYVDIRLAVAKDISKRLSSNGLHIEASSAEGFRSSFEIDISHRNDSESDTEEETGESVSSGESEDRFVPVMVMKGRRRTGCGKSLIPGSVTADRSAPLSRNSSHPRLLNRYIRLSF